MPSTSSVFVLARIDERKKKDRFVFRVEDIHREVAEDKVHKGIVGNWENDGVAT